MPLHEYECEACGHRFEVIQKFSDPPIETCPTCGGKVHKLISSPAFHLKGSGWYVTDYARKDSGGGAKTEDTGSKEQSGKDEATKKDEGSKTDEGSKKAESKDTSSSVTDASAKSDKTSSASAAPKKGES